MHTIGYMLVVCFSLECYNENNTNRRGVYMVRRSSKFVCQSCGVESAKWMGRCTACGEWNTLVEETTAANDGRGSWVRVGTSMPGPKPITVVSSEAEERFSSGITELDRVLGGGIVLGSLGLVGGEPGIGKSTLLMQAAAYTARTRGAVLYVSGEESAAQLRLRAQRLGGLDDSLYVLCGSDAASIIDQIHKLKPRLVIVDSIQTMYCSEIRSAPGSVSQVREAAAAFLRVAKTSGTPIILVGHVTKGGSFAGPKVLEHAVDYVLYFEGDSHHTFRVVRGVKNRFGSTHEVGIFDMKESGLAEVPNPSALLVSQRLEETPGSVVVCGIEGTRPLMVEVQALTSFVANNSTPRRQTTGIDYQRFCMILAVMEKRLGLRLSNQDVYLNVAGGFRLSEPAADLAAALAVSSSVRGRPMRPQMAVFGEVGLGGEVRSVGMTEQRLREAAKLGFSSCLLPAANMEDAKEFRGLQVVGVHRVAEAVDYAFSEQH